jgi:hypothetical protein
MGVTANDGHPGLGQSQFRTDYMDNSLIDAVQIIQPHAKFVAVPAQCLNLLSRNRIGNRQQSIGRWHIVVLGCYRQFRASNPSSGDSQSLKGLGTGDFMDQVQVNVEQGLSTRLFMNEVVLPDFLEHRSRCVTDHFSYRFIPEKNVSSTPWPDASGDDARGQPRSRQRAFCDSCGPALDQT